MKGSFRKTKATVGKMEQQNFTEKKEASGIDLVELFYLFRNKLVLILIFFILGGLVGYGYTSRYQCNVYSATSKIFVVSPSNGTVLSINDLSLGSKLTGDYIQLLVCRRMLESVVNNLGLNISASALKGMISVNNPEDTRILEITVRSTDPNIPVQVANELARLSESWFPQVMDSTPPSLFEEAIGCSVYTPSYSTNTAVGALAGAALVYGICVLRYMLNDTIRSSEDLERYFGVVPLTTIPEVKTIGTKKLSSSSSGEKSGEKKEREVVTE